MAAINSITRWGAILLLPIFVAGCASTGGMSMKQCAIAGALIGGGAGTAAGDDAARAISAGAVIGGVAGALLCAGNREEPQKSGPVDSDGDGVPDNLDRCPNTPPGRTVDSNGCELDSDGDGVVDGMDQCPGTAKGVKVDGRGCPMPQTVVMSDSDAVNFEFDKSNLTPAAMSTLDGMVQTLQSTAPKGLTISGHTDSVGTDAYNMGLSQRRAASVADYLASKGIDRGRMKSAGFGESHPVVANDTAANRAKNRRVEIELME